MTAAAAEAGPASPPSTGPHARVQRYRAKHRRIDYVPSRQALASIEAWLSRNLCTCTSGVIDKLVEAGHKAISGNAVRRL